MKKILSLALLLIMLFASTMILGSCKDDTTDPETPEEPEAGDFGDDGIQLPIIPILPDTDN